MRNLLYLLFFCVPGMCVTGMAQLPAFVRPVAMPSLATPRYHGQRILVLFKNDPYPAHFDLITSWVPGSDGKGYFRYMVILGPADAAGNNPKTPPTLEGWQPQDSLKRMEACSYSLRIYAIGRHLITTIPLRFLGDVNWTNEYDTLTANDLSPMPLPAYEAFLKSPVSANWDITPACRTRETDHH